MKSTVISLRDRRIFFILLLFVCVPLVVVKGQSPDTLQAFHLFRKADSLQKYARIDSSSHYFDRAAELYRRSETWRRVADCYLNLGSNQIEAGNFEEAAQTARKSEGLVKQHLSRDRTYRAKVCRLHGRLNAEQSKYDSAIDLFERGLALLNGSPEKHPKLQTSLLFYRADVFNSQGKYKQALQQFFDALDLYNRAEKQQSLFISQIYNSIGIAQQNLGHNDSALEYYHKSIAIDRQQLGPNHPDVASGLNNIAIIYYYQGDYQKALDYMKEATRTMREYWGRNHPQVAIGYNNISIVYSEMGELQEAIRYMKKSIAIKQKVIGEVNKDVAIGYQNLGALYYDLEDYDKAIKNYRKALKLHRQIFEGPHPEISNIYANLGEAYSAKKNYKKALEFLRKDLQMNTRLLGDEHPFIADTHSKIARNLRLTGNPTAALRHYRQAISILTGSDISEAGVQALRLDGITHPVFLLEALEGKAKVHRAIYEETGQEASLRSALYTYLEGASLVEKMQREYNSDPSKLMLGERAYTLFRAGLDTAYNLYEDSGDRKYFRYALYFIERSKARVLMEQLMENDARTYAGLSDSVISKEQRLRKAISRLHNKIRDKTGRKIHIDSMNVAGLQDSLFSLEQKLDDHIHSLEQKYPKYYRLKYRDITITPTFIQQQLLQKGQTLVEYAMGDKALYALVVNRQQITLHKTAIDSTLQSQVRDFREAIMEEKSSEFAGLSYSLYRKLLQPLRRSIKSNHLVIVPDGILNYIPFEALIEKPVTHSDSFENLPYLVRDFTVSYAPSATFLKYWEQHAARPAPPSRSSFVAFAPVFAGRDTSAIAQTRYSPPASPLPLSRYEVKKVDSLLQDEGFTSTVFLESEASESTFKRLPLQQYDIIHLASHAVLSNDSLSVPGIYFMRKPGQTEDGILRLDEVYNLDLNARLVVLSACDTGLGQLRKGEGIMSLARAFQYAGAHNLMVSLWPVDDRSTSKLMVQFYRNLLKENSTTDAVRQAKLRLMKSKRYAAPRYWAPFVLIGK